MKIIKNQYCNNESLFVHPSATSKEILTTSEINDMLEICWIINMLDNKKVVLSNSKNSAPIF